MGPSGTLIPPPEEVGVSASGLTDESGLFEVNTLDQSVFDSSWFDDVVFILRELEAPEGYEKAEDIEFKIRKQEETTDKIDDDGKIIGTESYYYTYIETGDGEETRCLKMKDDYTEEVIDDDDDDVTDEDTTENKNKENSPDTGDHTDFLIWLFVCFLSLGGIGVAFRFLLLVVYL